MTEATRPLGVLYLVATPRPGQSEAEFLARIGAALIFATHQPQFLAGRGFAALRAQIQSGPGGHVSTFSEAA